MAHLQGIQSSAKVGVTSSVAKPVPDNSLSLVFDRLVFTGAAVGRIAGSLLSVAVIVLYAMTGMAQNITDSCRPAAVVPLASGTEPPAKIVVDPPLAV
jgi:hypothetical protein